MLVLEQFDFNTTVWGTVTIYPRAEKIVSANKDCLNVEILCAIETETSLVAASSFFKTLTTIEHIKFFKILLNSIFNEPLSTNFTISINTPIQVIRNAEEIVPMLMHSKKQKLALELCETDIQQLGAYEYGVLEAIDKMPNVNLWLDDFGNNQSNFDVLLSKNINIHTVKISKELFWGLLKTDVHFLRSILTYLSKDYGVIVEGVETKEHFDYISSIKGIVGQGYFFNPVPELVNG